MAPMALLTVALPLLVELLLVAFSPNKSFGFSWKNKNKQQPNRFFLERTKKEVYGERMGKIEYNQHGIHVFFQ